MTNWPWLVSCRFGFRAAKLWWRLRHPDHDGVVVAVWLGGCSRAWVLENKRLILWFRQSRRRHPVAAPGRLHIPRCLVARTRILKAAS
jgi:hypothetical protein